MRKSLTIVSSLLLIISAQAQSTKMLTGDKSNEYGIIYSLPQTNLQIDLTATFTEKVAGPFRQYAPRYLGSTDVVEADSRSCEVTDVAISTYGTAGPEKYIMTVKPGALTSICVAEDGMILSINREEESPERQIPAEHILPARPDMDEYLQFVDEDFLVSLSDAKKAQMLARTIMEIRESRLSLSRGTAETMPTDGRQLELMLHSLQQQENALMRAFTGYEYTYSETRRISILPDSAMLDGERRVIARVAPGEHFRNGDDLVGAPIYLTISDLSTPEMPTDAAGAPKSYPKDGVAYCLPSTATVTVTYDGRTLLSRQVELSQGGEIFGLNPKLFTDKKAPSCAVFNPATGALVSISQMPQTAQ